MKSDDDVAMRCKSERVCGGRQKRGAFVCTNVLSRPDKLFPVLCGRAREPRARVLWATFSPRARGPALICMQVDAASPVPSPCRSLQTGQRVPSERQVAVR